jgi:hypothetical protein
MVISSGLVEGSSRKRQTSPSERASDRKKPAYSCGQEVCLLCYFLR